jgi:hypothetical protein
MAGRIIAHTQDGAKFTESRNFATAMCVEKLRWDIRRMQYGVKVGNTYCYLININISETHLTIIIQGDQNVSVHLMIKVQKHTKIRVFQTISITYHDKVFKIKNNK